MKLPSGKELKITVADFATSKALYMAVMEEAKGLKIDSQDDLNANLMKDLFCTALSSKKIEACLWECFASVTIDKVKITKDTFEPVEMRADYFEVCFEVAQVNLHPFLKNLYAKFSQALGKVKDLPA